MKFLVTNPEGADFGTVESKGNTLKGAMMEFKNALVKRCNLIEKPYFRGNTLYVNGISFTLKEVK